MGRKEYCRLVYLVGGNLSTNVNFGVDTIMKTIDRIEKILQEDQSYRDSDRLLLLRYWREQGLVLTEGQISTFMRCTTAETITRARRALKDQYPASDKINEERYQKSLKYRGQKEYAYAVDETEEERLDRLGYKIAEED